MNTAQEKPKFFRTILNDIQQFFVDLFSGAFLQNMKKDYQDVKEFFLEEERRDRLEQMGKIRRFIYGVFWLLQALILRLSSFRRILLIIGIILLFSARNQQDTFNNLILLGALLILFTLLLELKDKLLARRELEAGRSVQIALMPETSPDIPGWDAWLFTRPANDVGGDLVDYLYITKDRHAITVGDIAGKGLAAALFMAKLQSILRALAPDYTSLSELFTKLNQIFHRDGLPNSFASLVYLELMPDTSSVRFVNAGHFPPLHLSKGRIIELEKGNPALGLVANTVYNEVLLTLEQGDFLILYSDGITEAMNDSREFFGEERFHRLLLNIEGRSAKSAGEYILHSVDTYIGQARATDDLSIAVLRKR